MRRIVVAGLGTLLIALSLPAVAQAQNWIQIQGTIQAVDCQTNALVLNARDGTHVFPVAANATVTINSAPVIFCALRQYVGSKATVTIATGTPTVAAGVDVIPTAAPAAPPPALPGPAAPAPVPGDYGPYYPYYGYPSYYGTFFVIGIGIGFGPGFRHGRDRDRRLVGTPRFHDGDRDRRLVGTPRFHDGNRDRRFNAVPGSHGRDGRRR